MTYAWEKCDAERALLHTSIPSDFRLALLRSGVQIYSVLLSTIAAMLVTRVLQKTTLVCLASAVIAVTHALPGPSELRGSKDDFNWTSIESKRHLRWRGCYHEYRCARLTVPLDWTNASNANEISIALVKLPATVDHGDASFGGAVILNPGGPSGSGTDDLLTRARQIQNIVDGSRHFEIIGFDPRGVGRTTPSPLCFETDEAREHYEKLDRLGGGVDVESALNTNWALAQGLGYLCTNSSLGVYSNGDNIKKYVSTALVARDMVRIIDAITEERQIDRPRHSDNIQSMLRKPIEKSLLNFWGFSYGSYLGNVFASKFPERIGRMILDGVVDAPDYAATGWSSNLYDNNIVWRTFFQWCYEAGKRCALFDEHTADPLSMHAKVINLFDNIKQNPIPYIDRSGKLNLLSYFNIQQTMHMYAYIPYHAWPRLAMKIAALLTGDPYPFLDTSNLAYPGSPEPNSTMMATSGAATYDPRFLNRTSPNSPSYPHGLDASVAILCGDGTDITSDTKADYASYVSLLVNESALVGPTWAQITLSCRHWPQSLRPEERNRFAGPFGSRLADYDNTTTDLNGKGQWARPLLFIGNTADPVTPLRNALEMSKGHEGSRVLTLDTPGHCTGANMPSRCVWDAIRELFNDGNLPEEGKKCAVDWKPWDQQVGLV